MQVMEGWVNVLITLLRRVLTSLNKTRPDLCPIPTTLHLNTCAAGQPDLFNPAENTMTIFIAVLNPRPEIEHSLVIIGYETADVG